MTQNDVDNGRLILLLGLSPKFDGATPFAVIPPVLAVRPPSLRRSAPRNDDEDDVLFC
jgi:hypothetical protein